MKKIAGVLIGILMMLMFASSANAKVILIDKTHSYDSDKYNFPAQYTDPTYGITIEIQSVQKIEGGIEILARAWKDGKQLGFGKDGSVEIERFKIFNPPILVDDPLGLIERRWINEKTGLEEVRKLREDPIQAIRESLAHTIHLVGKEGKNIVKDKIGSTTSTFYPDPDVESTSVDGLVNNDPVSATGWTIIHDAIAGTGAKPSATLDTFARVSCHSTSNTYDIITRSFFLFDTSTIPDSDTINSATLSIKGNGGTDTWVSGTKPNINIVASTPASNIDLVMDDFDQLGTTAFSTAKTTATWSTSAYNDFTLNASGLTAISKTSVSKFGARDMIYDAPNIEPTWASGQQVIFQGNYTDNVGTSSDPKLVVEHSASAPDTIPPTISSVSATNITSNLATITWTTDVPATSQVEYGPTTSYGTPTTLDSNLVYSHNVNLTGLNTDTLYHYRVKSKDAANNEAISADYTFHTAVAPLSLRLPFRDGESWYVTQGNGQGASHQGNEYYAWDFNSVDDWGKPVLAPASGKVVDASAICLTENDLNDTCNSGWGNYVIIDYGNGKFGKLAHLRLVSVKKGQYVFQGEQVGTVGSTGKSSGPHIHYQTQNSSALGGQSIASSFVDVSSNGGVPIGCDCPNDVGTNRYTSGNTAPALIYHLDTALDSSNNGNNGTISTCLIAGCMGLNGTSSDYIEILNSSSLQLAGDVSIVFWLKPENAGSGRINFLDKSYFGEFSLILETDGSLSYYHGQSTSSFFSWVALGAGTIANGQGIRIAVTRNSAEAYMRTYVNGALVSITPYGGNIPSASTSPLKIGLGATGIPYKGKADEIAIYPRVLTDNEVNNEYYSSKP